MRYPTINPLVAICCLPILTACGSLMAAMEVIKNPEVQEALVRTATDAATGNWLGAICGVGATIAAVAGHKTLKKVKKARDSSN